MVKEFLNYTDIMNIMGVSKSKAYQIIQDLNEELKDKGYIVIAGKVSSKYFLKRTKY